MKPVRFMVWSATAACVGVLALSANAQGRRPLPPEAYSACDGKSEGDSCSVQLPSREIEGTCQKESEGGGLFCLPKNLPPPLPAPRTAP